MVGHSSGTKRNQVVIFKYRLIQYELRLEKSIQRNLCTVDSLLEAIDALKQSLRDCAISDLYLFQGYHLRNEY